MKLSKKKVVALALAVCLIAILSMGSLAWFTDDDSVTNNFYIAGSEDQNPDDVFSVDVWEDKDPIDNGEDKIQDGIKYNDILPGDDLYKEVNIENTGAYDQYVRATVKLSDANIWQQIYGVIYVPLNEIATDLNPEFEAWSTVYDAEANTLTYVLYYKNILKVDEIVTLFTNVAIPEALTRDQAAKMQDFNLSVVADAVQTENVGDDAKAAFATVGMATEEGDRTINVTAANVGDVLSFMANNKDAEVKLDMTDKTVEQSVVNQGTLDITGGTIDVEAAGLQNVGTATLTDVKMEAGTDKSYSNITVGENASTTYNNVDVVSNGGGIGAADGAEVDFNSGSMIITATTTNPRYIFYVEGEGTEVTINGGTFDFTAKTLKRAYIYAGAGTTVYVNGGNFGTPSTRSGYNAGIMGDGTVIITGGTFGFNPTQWVAPGYVATESNGVWTVAAQ